jgi:16S rRNA (guanine527-N7)-methyltransferase
MRAVVAEFAGLRQEARRRLSLELSPAHLEAFRRYAEELQEWNQRFNLTAITDPVGIQVRHFLDSLTCLLGFGASARGHVVDVGTGAGFPGLPIKVVRPEIELTLVEATAKKAGFCRHIVEALELEGVEVIHARAETLGQRQGHRESYDLALARAVAPLPVLVEYLLPLLRIGGRAIAQKGETAHAETHEAGPALDIVGGRVDRLIPVELPGVVERRYLVVLDKVAATPEKYPRRPGMPSKRPLA